MRKLVSMLLIMLVAFGVVFAEEVITIKDGGFQGYAVNLKAEVNSSIVDPDDPDDQGSDTPDTIVHDGLYLKVGLDVKNTDRTMGAVYKTGDLLGLQNYEGDKALAVSLTPANEEDNTGKVTFYVVAATDCAADKGSGMTVTFACTDNKWKYASSVAEGSKTPEGPAIDLTVVEALTAETNGLAATKDNPVVVSAKAGSRTTDKAFIYVAQTEASWTKDANLTPGNYKAEIKVTVAAN